MNTKNAGQILRCKHRHAYAWPRTYSTNSTLLGEIKHGVASAIRALQALKRHKSDDAGHAERKVNLFLARGSLSLKFRQHW